MKCTHHYCRCMRSNELSLMGLHWEAIQVHNSEVTCRKEETEPAVPRQSEGD